MSITIMLILLPSRRKAFKVRRARSESPLINRNKSLNRKFLHLELRLKALRWSNNPNLKMRQ